MLGYVDQHGGKRLIRVNDYHIDVLLDGPLLMILNDDVPGVVGEVGTLLGNNAVNIAEYSLSRLEGDTALSLIKCDSAPSEGIIEKLKSISSIKTCYFLG
jgi:D-3-phosphoglycerate dehydrogenase